MKFYLGTHEPSWLRRLAVPLFVSHRRLAQLKTLPVARTSWALGLRLHGFGFKTQGLAFCSRFLSSSDSLAWSSRARYAGSQPGCTHKSCANCPRFALSWREQVLASVGRPEQPELWEATA